MKKLKTKKRGDYSIVTLALREPLLSLLDVYCRDKNISRSTAIRELIKSSLSRKGYHA